MLALGLRASLLAGMLTVALLEFLAAEISHPGLAGMVQRFLADGEIREALREDEAMLSFYFGTEGSFVWAVPKQGPPAFAAVAAPAASVSSWNLVALASVSTL